MLINNKYFKFTALLFITCCFAAFLTRPVGLTRTDIGRHLKNGELICAGFSQTLRSGILNTNYYSYTYPAFPVINHHWGSGVIFYIVHKYAGFKGLNVFYTFLGLLTFFVLLNLSIGISSFSVVLFSSVLLLTLMTERFEIRPEIFSCLFCSIFYRQLYKFQSGAISIKKLLILPLLEVLWVNTHIYFVFGFLITGAFLAEEFVRRTGRLNSLLLLFGTVVAASFVNPFGLKGLIYPFTIFKNYGYRILENQSVQFLIDYGIQNPNLQIYKFVVVVFAASFFMVFLLRFKSFPVANFLIGAVFSVMGWFAIRNFTLFGFLALPIIVTNIQLIYSKKTADPKNVFNKILVIMAVLIFAVYYGRLDKFKILSFKNLGIGQVSGDQNAAEFFVKAGIQGPVLNNYDIGGYLIYYLYPSEKVFVDNRPEAYPKEFFENEYVPMQENDFSFKRVDGKYKFNTIFFSSQDLTPWGQKFMTGKINDPEWAPVYIDNLAVIFVKRNELNKEIIRKYEIRKM